MIDSKRKVICAIDTGDVQEAISIVRKLGPYVGAFKVGHALTLPNGLGIIDRLQDQGAERIFLDLKFHDIPNSVALGVKEAAKHGVWMTTLHISGGPAMMTAAVEEANNYAEDVAPLLIGVSVLTSIDQTTLQNHLGIVRELEHHMVELSQMAMECGLDGVVCSPLEIRPIRHAIGHGVIVTPGIRLPSSQTNDQKRVADAKTSLEAGADYLVIGRILTDANDPIRVLHELGLIEEQPV